MISHKPVSTRASVAVVLATTANRLLLQLRDDSAGIEYPGYWSLLAGWIEAGETPHDALWRELREELSVVDGDSIVLRSVTFLDYVERTDRPWGEYVFYARLATPTETISINEGRGFGEFRLGACIDMEKIADHHREHLRRYQRRLEELLQEHKAPERDDGNEKEESRMKTVEEHIEVSELGSDKDYAALEVGDGFVLATTTMPTAALHTKSPARFIALLEFLHDTPRGNHYHLRKVEYMIVLRGRLRCNFALASVPTEKTEVVLTAGQMVRILPGCVHTFTAEGGDVLALEYAGQRFEASDVIVIE